MGLLTTHVLDTSRGAPAAGLLIDLFRLGSKPTERTHLRTIETSTSGHTDGALIEGDALVPGVYELLFHVGRYFRRSGVGGVGSTAAGGGGAAAATEPPFLDLVPVRFAIADAAQSYEIALAISPWSYAVYRER
ncbi:MAG TPA: hydroxyisourate hydrolase [Stellaceae bacterium]|jgi:5-hydroxyisourate hydrolase